MFQFGTYCIVAHESGPIEALQKSAAITRGYKWQLLLLGLALIGINLVGLVACCIGLLATVPLSMGATAFAFRKLESRPGLS
jgi:uncharacterized membrane protein